MGQVMGRAGRFYKAPWGSRQGSIGAVGRYGAGRRVQWGAMGQQAGCHWVQWGAMGRTGGLPEPRPQLPQRPAEVPQRPFEPRVFPPQPPQSVPQFEGGPQPRAPHRAPQQRQPQRRAAPHGCAGGGRGGRTAPGEGPIGRGVYSAPCWPRWELQCLIATLLRPTESPQEHLWTHSAP